MSTEMGLCATARGDAALHANGGANRLVTAERQDSCLCDSRPFVARYRQGRWRSAREWYRVRHAAPSINISLPAIKNGNI